MADKEKTAKEIMNEFAKTIYIDTYTSKGCIIEKCDRAESSFGLIYQDGSSEGYNEFYLEYLYEIGKLEGSIDKTYSKLDADGKQSVKKQIQDATLKYANGLEKKGQEIVNTAKDIKKNLEEKVSH